MSPLRKIFKSYKIKTRPSPANEKLFVKGISRLISKLRIRSVHGSMTVEAALLIPVFFFAILYLAGIMELLRLHGKLEAALWNAGNQMTLYTETFSEATEDIPDVGISYLLVHNQVVGFLGEDYLEASPLANGANGLNYLRSEYLDEDDCVDIIVTYQVKPIANVSTFGYRRMSNRYYARAWTGYDLTQTQSEIKYVYVTSGGEAWHSIPNCSYIYHQVNGIPAEGIDSIRNDQGKKYELCTLCKKRPAGTYAYYTREGERYHYIRNCSAIYKNVRAVAWHGGLKYRPCSRCAGP